MSRRISRPCSMVGQRRRRGCLRGVEDSWRLSRDRRRGRCTALQRLAPWAWTPQQDALRGKPLPFGNVKRCRPPVRHTPRPDSTQARLCGKAVCLAHQLLRVGAQGRVALPAVSCLWGTTVCSLSRPLMVADGFHPIATSSHTFRLCKAAHGSVALACVQTCQTRFHLTVGWFEADWPHTTPHAPSGSGKSPVVTGSGIPLDKQACLTALHLNQSRTTTIQASLIKVRAWDCSMSGTSCHSRVRSGFWPGLL